MICISVANCSTFFSAAIHSYWFHHENGCFRQTYRTMGRQMCPTKTSAEWIYCFAYDELWRKMQHVAHSISHMIASIFKKKSPSIVDIASAQNMQRDLGFIDEPMQMLPCYWFSLRVWRLPKGVQLSTVSVETFLRLQVNWNAYVWQSRSSSSMCLSCSISTWLNSFYWHSSMN